MLVLVHVLSAGLVAVLLAACAADVPVPADPPDHEIVLAPSLTPPRPTRPAIAVGPSRARPLTDEAAAAYRAQLAAMPAPTTPEEVGRIDAIHTILAGRIMLATLGYPAPCARDYERVLAAEYDVVVTRVAGCVVEPGVAEEAAGFNEVMEAELERRYGGDVLRTISGRVGC